MNGLPSSPDSTALSSISAPSDFAALFPEPEFSKAVDSLPPAIIRSSYDSLLATCDKPDLLRSLVRDLIQTRQKLHCSIDKSIAAETAKQNIKDTLEKERVDYVTLEIENDELKKKMDGKTVSVLRANTELLLQQEKTRATAKKLEEVEREKKTIEEVFLYTTRTVQGLKAKRTADVADMSSPRSNTRSQASKKSKLSHDPTDTGLHGVACTQCYTKSWDCDGAEHCSNCLARNIPCDGCKRVKCQYFDAGTCTKQQCTLAHEEDGYKALISFMGVRRPGGGSPPD